MSWYYERGPVDADHRRFDKVPDFGEFDPRDRIAGYDAMIQRTREEAVKFAHLRIIGDKLRRCYNREGTFNYQQRCRHLVAEFLRSHREVMGWKEGADVSCERALAPCFSDHAGLIITFLFRSSCRRYLVSRRELRKAITRIEHACEFTIKNETWTTLQIKKAVLYAR
jgi:hypothetical protein